MHTQPQVASFVFVQQWYTSSLQVAEPTPPGVSTALRAWELLVPVSNAPTREIVGRKLYSNAITRQNADVVHPHLP